MALMPVAPPVTRPVLCLSPSMHRCAMGSDDFRIRRHMREDRPGCLALDVTIFAESEKPLCMVYDPSMTPP